MAFTTSWKFQRTGRQRQQRLQQSAAIKWDFSSQILFLFLLWRIKSELKLIFITFPPLPAVLFKIGDGQPITQPNASAQKKNSSRRNAWGNLSYADLITQAINSAVDRRLTLSQIYEWMVQNVAYFKDKGDSNSSAGWKVSSTFRNY